MIDERRVHLDGIAAEGTSLQSTYDFGDDWEHTILVEKVLAAGDSPHIPACIDGRRACPPEDCGGPWGYEELVAIAADPTHPQWEAQLDWLGRPFEPEAFSTDEFAHNLEAFRRMR